MCSGSPLWPAKLVTIVYLLEENQIEEVETMRNCPHLPPYWLLDCYCVWTYQCSCVHVSVCLWDYHHYFKVVLMFVISSSM